MPYFHLDKYTDTVLDIYEDKAPGKFDVDKIFNHVEIVAFIRKRAAGNSKMILKYLRPCTFEDFTSKGNIPDFTIQT